MAYATGRPRPGPKLDSNTAAQELHTGRAERFFEQRAAAPAHANCHVHVFERMFTQQVNQQQDAGQQLQHVLKCELQYYLGGSGCIQPSCMHVVCVRNSRRGTHLLC